jgi:hypothetical protein
VEEEIKVEGFQVAIEVSADGLIKPVNNPSVLSSTRFVVILIAVRNVRKNVDFLAGFLRRQQDIMQPLKLSLQGLRLIKNPPIEDIADVVVESNQTQTGTHDCRVISASFDSLQRIRWQNLLPQIRDVIVKPLNRQRLVAYIWWRKASTGNS